MIPNCCTAPFKKVTHVIFDLDGTLLDSETVVNAALQQIAADHGKEFTQEIKQKVTGCLEKETAARTIHELKLPLTVDEFVKLFRKYSYDKLPDCALMPGAEKLVKHLYKKGIPLSIATSSSEDEVKLKCQNHKDLMDMFHHIVCAGSDPEVEWGKPNPAVFLVCASRYDDKPDPAKCLVFEDSANGVKAAVAAGMQVIMVPEKYVSYDYWKLATLRLDSLECMIPELFGLPAFKEEEEEETSEDEEIKEIVKLEPSANLT